MQQTSLQRCSNLDKQEETMGKAIVIASGKGGTGKSQ